MVYLTEALGGLENRKPQRKERVTVVIADEFHEETLFTQMIICLMRLQMATQSSMMLILMLVNEIGGGWCRCPMSSGEDPTTSAYFDKEAHSTTSCQTAY